MQQYMFVPALFHFECLLDQHVRPLLYQLRQNWEMPFRRENYISTMEAALQVAYNVSEAKHLPTQQPKLVLRDLELE